MKRTRSPSGNGPDHPKPPRKHTEYKSDRRKLRPSIKIQVAPLNLCLFQQPANHVFADDATVRCDTNYRNLKTKEREKS